jgi:hypothetical protein
VIADSGRVEVYVMDKQDMQYIPDHILKGIFEDIAQEKEPDRPNRWDKIDEVKDQIIKWEDFKVECVKKMFLRKLQEAKYNASR